MREQRSESMGACERKSLSVVARLGWVCAEAFPHEVGGCG